MTKEKLEEQVEDLKAALETLQGEYDELRDYVGDLEQHIIDAYRAVK